MVRWIRQKLKADLTVNNERLMKMNDSSLVKEKDTRLITTDESEMIMVLE